MVMPASPESSELRWRWATALGGMALGWTVAGIALALALDWSTRNLILWWFAPSLPGLTYAIDLAREHLATARRKQQLLIELDECLVTLPTVTERQPPLDRLVELMVVGRANQDQITRLRLATARVPQWFYDRYRDKDEDVARRTAEDFRGRLLGGPTS